MYPEQHSSDVPLLNSSTKDWNSFVSCFSEPISINPRFWWQMTGARPESHGDWQGRLFHPWHPLLCHICPNKHRCKGTHFKTQMSCAGCRSDSQCPYQWRMRKGYYPHPLHPFNLNQQFPLYWLWLQRKMAVIRWLVGPVFLLFFFYVFNPTKFQCLYVHLSYSLSSFPQFFSGCPLSFCSIISQAPSKGKFARQPWAYLLSN